MRDFPEDFAWQSRFRGQYEEIALSAVRIRVAGWDDDTKRNTDLQIATLENGHRVMCRARRVAYRPRFASDFTIRHDRPTGTPSEFAKIHQGFGDFGIYGFEAEPDSDRLYPWAIYNVRLLREYLDGDGRWVQRVNGDGSSSFAVFSLNEMPLGFVLNSEGHGLQGRPFEIQPAVGPCRLCGRPCWFEKDGVEHPCCWLNEITNPGRPCPACLASDVNADYRYGWKGRTGKRLT